MQVEWINVTDSIPDEGVVVLVEYDDGTCGLDSTVELEEGQFCWETDFDVTYWMPFPEREGRPKHYEEESSSSSPR